jgi:hypothetical protein
MLRNGYRALGWKSLKSAFSITALNITCSPSVLWESARKSATLVAVALSSCWRQVRILKF